MVSNTRIKNDFLTVAFFLAAIQSFFSSQGYADAVTASATLAATPTGSVTAQRADELWERGNELARKNYMKKADEYREAAQKLDPSISGRRIKAIPLSPDSDKQKRVDELVSRAEEACDKRDFSLALKYVDTVESLSPGEPRAKAIRERVALEDYKSDPDRPYDSMVKSFFDKAVHEYHNQNYSRALEIVDKSLELDENNQQVKDLKKLIKSKNSATQTEKDMDRAAGLWEDGDADGALRILDNVLQNNPGYPPALELKRKIEDSSVKVKLKAAQADVETASGKEKSGQYMAAQKYYEKALKADPGNKEAVEGLERVKALVEPLEAKLEELGKAVKAGDKVRAEKLVAEIKELDPDNARLKILEKKAGELGPKTTALDAEAKAAEAFDLGLKSYGNNDFASAKKFWSEALQWNPKHVQARRNLDRLLEEHPELKDP